MTGDQHTQLPEPRERRAGGLGPRLMAIGIVLIGGLLVALSYAAPMVKVGLRDDPTYSLEDMAHYGTPGVGLVTGAAAVLCIAVVWAAIEEGRGAVAAVLCFAIAVAVGAMVVLVIGFALLPNVPSVGYRSRELSWGPGLPMITLGIAATLAGSIWWSVQVYRD